ncbi:MAG: hypothetical protein MZV65_40355 [Chromatiales bacterium]|nr:hypothetical protein [Chromatiales bacterium]
MLLWVAALPVHAQISEAKVEALVEALRLSAPEAGPDAGLYSDWSVKPDNIVRWSRRCLDRDVTPEQFAADEAAGPAGAGLHHGAGAARSVRRQQPQRNRRRAARRRLVDDRRPRAIPQRLHQRLHPQGAGNVSAFLLTTITARGG